MIVLHHLKLGYGGKTVVDLPDFKLQQGHHCLITGHSGSGKTTLLYALAGLLSPMHGTVRIADTDLTALPKAQADLFRGRHIGIIYQTLHMAAPLTVLQNLLLAQYAAGLRQDAAKAAGLLQKLGIANKQHDKPSALSHGQQQRAAIARAAMNSPKVILGDEPTSALDDESCEVVMHLLLQVAEASGASLVVATHDQRIKKHFSKRVVLGGAQ